MAIDAERVDCSRTHATCSATHNHNTGFDFPDNVGEIWIEQKHGSSDCRASGPVTHSFPYSDLDCSLADGGGNCARTAAAATRIGPSERA